MITLLRKIETGISGLEKIALVIMLGGLILVSFGSIVLRNLGVFIHPGVSRGRRREPVSRNRIHLRGARRFRSLWTGARQRAGIQHCRHSPG